jgi:sec-independent protein translocase protein TatB
MFDIGWSEMLVVGVVALVVIGPKELPAALRTAGRMVGKARGIASEFRQHWDDAMREAELDEIRKKAEEVTGIGDVKSTVENFIDPKGEISEAAKVTETPAIEAPPVVAEATPAAPAPAPETPPRP